MVGLVRVGEAADALRHQPMFVQVLHDASAPVLRASELETCCAQFAYEPGGS